MRVASNDFLSRSYHYLYWFSKNVRFAQRRGKIGVQNCFLPLTSPGMLILKVKTRISGACYINHTSLAVLQNTWGTNHHQFFAIKCVRYYY